MNRIARMSVTALVALVTTVGIIAPAEAGTWHPHLVPLSATDVQHAAAQYRQICAPGIDPEMARFQTAFCTPSKPTSLLAVRRLGWCYRWAVERPAKISQTCLSDLRRGWEIGL